MASISSLHVPKWALQIYILPPLSTHHGLQHQAEKRLQWPLQSSLSPPGSEGSGTCRPADLLPVDLQVRVGPVAEDGPLASII